MKTALILVFLFGLSTAFYINRFQRKWKGSDSDEKALPRNRYGYYFYRNLFLQGPNRHYINIAKGGDSSEENEDSSDEVESPEVIKNGNKAPTTGGSETGGTETGGTETGGSEGKGAAEEADSEEAEGENESENESENGGTSAPEVEDTTANQNETETEDGGQFNTTEISLETEPTQAGTIEPATRQVEAQVLDATVIPASTVEETLGNEEGSNGGIVSTVVYETPNDGYQYENGYDHENEIDYRTRGDTYARYEDEYHYRNHIYDGYAREYDYYHQYDQVKGM